MAVHKKKNTLTVQTLSMAFSRMPMQTILYIISLNDDKQALGDNQ